MESSVTEDSLVILHVSDAHFGVPDVRNEMPRIISKLTEAAQTQDLVPDICVFSGDLAQSGMASEFNKGLGWLLKLISKWPNTKLFLVPGNHDVQRNKANLVLRQAFVGEEDYAGKRPLLESSLAHLSGFFEFHAFARSEHPSKIISDWNNPFGCSHFAQCRGRAIRMLGLNTSLLSCANDDSGKLVADVGSLNALLNERSGDEECVIAVGHHPLNWLVGWNQEEVQRVLRQKSGAHLYLHGHQHEQVALTLNTSKGESLVTLECGAAYQSSKWPSYFSIYRLDFPASKIETAVYALAPSSGDWIKNNERSGTILAELPQPLGEASGLGGLIQSVENQKQQLIDAHQDLTGHPAIAAGEPFSDEHMHLEAYQRWENGNEVFRRVSAIFDNEFLKKLPVPIYRSESRLKERARIAGKVLRRAKKGQAYSVSDVEDVCGFRFVSVFQSDVPQLMDAILKQVIRCTSVKFDPNLRIVVHTNRPENDPLSIRPLLGRFVEEWVGHCAIKYSNSETGYSSVHVVLDGSIPGFKRIELPIEIQFRSGLEEFWGQLDHKLRYSDNRGTVGDNDWDQHLNVLKAYFDAAIQYTDLIKKISQRRIPASPLKSDSGATPESWLSISDPTVQVASFKSVLPEVVFKMLDEAYRLWRQADASKQFGGNKRLYEEAAYAFLPLVDGYPSEVTDEQVSRRLSQTARMERAYMLSESSTVEGLDIARSIYESVLEQDPVEPTALFRMGLLLIRSKKFKASIQYLNRAMDVTKDIAKPQSDNEAARIFDYARMNKGVVYFRAFEDAEKTVDERIEALRTAIDTVRWVLGTGRDAKQKLNALNDFVYYLWEELEFVSRNPSIGGSLSESEAEFMKYARRLLDECASRDDMGFRERDTLCRICVSMGEPLEAEEHADAVITLLEQIATQRGATIVSGRLSLPWVTEVAAKLPDHDEMDSFRFAVATLEPRGKIN
jgi:ppGpp synthetase/RelA/SpoT-type nucleotidyltranferase